MITKGIFLESKRTGLLKNVKDEISRPLVSREIQKQKWVQFSGHPVAVTIMMFIMKMIMGLFLKILKMKVRLCYKILEMLRQLYFLIFMLRPVPPQAISTPCLLLSNIIPNYYSW